jgi:hypothetical protein
MKKIQKVIESCYECEFRSVYAKNSSKAHICKYSFLNKDEEIEYLEPLLLDVCDNGSNALPIPKNCPLEDYTGTKTFEE